MTITEIPRSETDRTAVLSLVHEQGRVEAILAERCLLDLEYAREPKEYRWRPWLQNWSWALFQLPILSLRDDNWYAILDGGHRVSALRAKFGANVEFKGVVLDGLDRETEAWLFTHFDTESKRPTMAEVFKANLFARQQEEVDINIVCLSVGVKIYGIHGAPQSGRLTSINRFKATYAIGTLREIYGRGGGTHLLKVMETIRDSWSGEHAAFDRFPMSAVSAFWLHWPRADQERLVYTINRKTPDQLRLAAVRLAEAFVNLGAAAQYGRRVLGEWYNRGLRTGRLKGSE